MEWRRLTQPEEPAFGRAMASTRPAFPATSSGCPMSSGPSCPTRSTISSSFLMGRNSWGCCSTGRRRLPLCGAFLRPSGAAGPPLRRQGAGGAGPGRENRGTGDRPAGGRYRPAAAGLLPEVRLRRQPLSHVHPLPAEYPGHELVVLSSPRALTPAEYGAFACYLSAVVMA